MTTEEEEEEEERTAAGVKFGGAGGDAAAAEERNRLRGAGVTYGEYVGVGVGLCFLLVFSYAVQYLVRHGIIVPPTVKN